MLNIFLLVCVFDENVRATPKQAAVEVVEKNTKDVEMTNLEKVIPLLLCPTLP